MCARISKWRPVLLGIHWRRQAPRPISRTLPPIATTRGATRRHTAHRFRSPHIHYTVYGIHTHTRPHRYTRLHLGSSVLSSTVEHCRVVESVECRYCSVGGPRPRARGLASDVCMVPYVILSAATWRLASKRPRDPPTTYPTPFSTLARRPTDKNSETHTTYIFTFKMWMDALPPHHLLRVSMV